jgi:hypothetical protein
MTVSDIGDLPNPLGLPSICCRLAVSECLEFGLTVFGTCVLGNRIVGAVESGWSTIVTLQSSCATSSYNYPGDPAISVCPSRNPDIV